MTFSQFKTRKQAENRLREWEQKLQREEVTDGGRMKEWVTFCRSSLLRTRPHSLAPVLVCLLMVEGSSTQQCCSTRSHTEFRLQSVTTISVILTVFLSQPHTRKEKGTDPRTPERFPTVKPNSFQIVHSKLIKNMFLENKTIFSWSSQENSSLFVS